MAGGIKETAGVPRGQGQSARGRALSRGLSGPHSGPLTTEEQQEAGSPAPAPAAWHTRQPVWARFILRTGGCSHVTGTGHTGSAAPLADRQQGRPQGFFGCGPSEPLSSHLLRGQRAGPYTHLYLLSGFCPDALSQLLQACQVLAQVPLSCSLGAFSPGQVHPNLHIPLTGCAWESAAQCVLSQLPSQKNRCHPYVPILQHSQLRLGEVPWQS